MRIIQVVPSIANLSSGPTYTVTRLSEQLRDMGHEVEIACVDRQGHRSTPPWIHRFPHVRLSGKLMMSPGLRQWLQEGAARQPSPVIHSNSLWQLPNLYAAAVARQLGVPHIVSPRGTLGDAAFSRGSILKPLLWRYLQRPALEAVDCFHATAPSEIAEIRKFGFGQPIALVPNGVDLPRDVARHQERRNEVLFLGRIHPKKGVDTLLRAWKAVQSLFPAWHLRIVGPDDTPYAKNMKALAVDLMLDRVEFSGEQVGPQRTSAYKRASVFILPTLNENFAVAVAESLSHGVPAIVTKGAPWSGLESHGCGWWVEQGIQPLVCALETAMSASPSVRYEMGLRGRVWMQQDFSWPVIGRHMDDVYRWLGAGRPHDKQPECVRLIGTDTRDGLARLSWTG